MSARDLPRAHGLCDEILAVLTAALDASYCNPAWIYAVAGYVGERDVWDAVMSEWNEALRGWRIDRFHLAELPSLVGREKTRQCEGYFANIVRGSNLHSIGSAIFTHDWEKPDWGHDDSPRFSTPYEQSLWFALNVLGEHCELEFPGQSITILCDVDSSEAAIQSVFKKAAEQRRCLDSITVTNRRRHKQLEVADLAAGSLRKSWVDITSNESSKLSWGVIPKSKRGRTSVWSLRQAAILQRAFRISQEEWRASLLEQRQLLENGTIRTRFGADADTDTSQESLDEAHKQIIEIDAVLDKLGPLKRLKE
jgi:hypothetical protein